MGGAVVCRLVLTKRSRKFRGLLNAIKGGFGDGLLELFRRVKHWQVFSGYVSQSHKCRMICCYQWDSRMSFLQELDRSTSSHGIWDTTFFTDRIVGIT